MKKKKRRKTKRIFKKVTEKKSLLKEANAEIDKELRRLSEERDAFKKEINGIDSSVGNAQELERKLQERIAALLEEEAKLTEKKKNIQVKTERLADKLIKIEKIKSEMDDI